MQMTSREPFRKYCDEYTFSQIQEMETIGEMLRRSVYTWPNAPAILYDEKTISYKELDRAVACARTELKKLGLQHGDRLLLHMPNSSRLLTLILAACTSGICAVITPPQLSAATVAQLTGLFGCKAAAGTEEDSGTFSVPLLYGEGAECEESAAENVSGSDDCLIMFTGGTTGRSKGAVLSQRAVMQGVVNGCYGYSEVFSQRYLMSLPLSHVFGLIRGTLNGLYTGSCVCICKSPQTMFRDAANFQPTQWIAVPAMVEMALSLSRKFAKKMLGDSMKVIICGAASVSPYLIQAWAEQGVSLFPGYGLTESANLVSGNPECIAKPESVGIPYPNQILHIADDGELLLQGKNMLRTYIGTKEQTFDEEGWFHTGDLARFDEDGFLYITGRTKEIIVLKSGEKVSPAEVEAKFNMLSTVQDCQIYETQNEHGISILALEVVPRMAEMKDRENLREQLMQHLEEINASLPAYQRASRIIIRDQDFERSPSMKILRYGRKV